MFRSGSRCPFNPSWRPLSGAVVVSTLTDDFLRVDLGFTLADAGDGDRLWGCLGSRDDPSGSRAVSRLLRCDSDWGELESCPREELGSVEADLPVVSRVEVLSASEIARLQSEMRRQRGMGGLGSGPGFREAVEELVAEAKRLGANALIDWEREGATLTARAVTISVDPSTCN